MNALDTAVFHAATGTSPYTVALMRILIEAQHEPEARAAIRSAIVRHRANGETEQVVRLSRLEALWRAHPQAWHVVRGTIASLAHDRTEVGASQMLDYWGSAFDRLAAEFTRGERCALLAWRSRTPRGSHPGSRGPDERLAPARPGSRRG